MARGSALNFNRTAVEAAIAKGEGYSWDSRVTGLGLRMTSAGAASFLIRFRIGSGAQRYLTLGRWPTLTVDQARALARERLAEVAAGHDPADTRRARREAPTLQALVDFWATTHAQARGNDPQTVKDGLAALRLYVPATLLRRKAAEVTEPDIMRVIADAHMEGSRRDAARVAISRARHDDAVAAGKPAPPIRPPARQPGVAQGNRVLATLSAAFGTALARRHRIANPVDWSLLRTQDERWRNLGEEEVARLLTACDIYAATGEDGREDAADVVRLLLFTGARLQEVLGAPWSQFSLVSGLWTKPSAATKQKKVHRLGLDVDSPAAELLRRRWERREGSAFVFPGKPAVIDGKERDAPRSDLKRHWPTIRDLAGLNRDDRLHDLRRTTASYMLDDGASLPTVGAALGHTSPKTTMRYASMRPTVQAAALGTSTRRMVRAVA